MSQFICVNDDRILRQVMGIPLAASADPFVCDVVRQISGANSCSQWWYIPVERCEQLLDDAYHTVVADGLFENTELGRLLLLLYANGSEVVAWWADFFDNLDELAGEPEQLVEVCTRQLKTFPPELYIHCNASKS